MNKNVPKYVISFILAGVLVYFAFRSVDWGAFWGGLAETRWAWMILFVVLLGDFGKSTMERQQQGLEDAIHRALRVLKTAMRTDPQWYGVHFEAALNDPELFLPDGC